MSVVYQTLAAVAYPMFKPKLETVEGLEHLPASGGYIIAANHVDWLDGFYISAAIGLAKNTAVHFLTKSNNYWWTTVAIQIPEEDKRSIIDVAVDELRAGKIICNFPEGVRNTDHRLQPGKTGTVRMAAAAGVPVVPLGITCPSGKTMAQSLRHLMLRGNGVTINIGAPLTFSGPMTGERLEQETRRLMEAIAPLAGKTV